MISRIKIRGEKSRRDDTLLTDGFNRRKTSNARTLPSPEGTFLEIRAKYRPFGPFGTLMPLASSAVRRLKPTVNQVLSLRDLGACVAFLIIVTLNACRTGKDEPDDVALFILSAEVTNKQTRNIVVDNDARRIDFDLARSESKTGVNIKLTLADGVSMVSPKETQANYDLTYPAEIKLSANGRERVFTIRAGVYDPITEFILAAEVANREAHNLAVNNAAKEITFDLAYSETRTGVNIKLTLADGVSMVSPATTQADYNLTNPAQIELLADGEQVIFTIAASTLYEEETVSDQQFAANLRTYLDAGFSSFITEVDAGANVITVKGVCTGDGDFALCEIPPYHNLTQVVAFPFSRPLSASTFTETFERFVSRDGFMYDRTLSKWAIVKKSDGNKDEFVSHARYPDNIHASQTMPQQKPTSKKGYGGFWNHDTQRQDLNDLGITSVTVNLFATWFMRSQPVGNVIEHKYGGKSYYFDRGRVEGFDATLRECADRGIVVAAILLIQPAAECLDREIGNLLQHPDFSGGYYTMPNMTNPESVNTYAAMLDFFANRYSRPGNQYGRIHHWIIHNEVNIAHVWTDMGGRTRQMLSVVDAYMKSMRICYNIVRRYDQHSEVFASFTQSWTSAVENGFLGLSMINAINDYSRVEGDFQWALAFHTYPQSLLEPKTWLDARATYATSTQLVTFKNLEVLDHWAKQPENRYKGVTKRSVWLSENGTNSRTYSETDQREQAAGFAWAWKKLNKLDGIDAMQWHGWSDHPDEAPLRIGLRTTDLAPKEVWYAYQAAGTTNEDNVFQKYLSVIGITDWNIIQNVNSD